MLHLAIECSGIRGSVALCRGPQPLAERHLPENSGSVCSLAATIAEMLAEFSVNRVELLSVTHGPGSFTGLRCGLATGKMLAFAWDIPIVGVDTLAAIAVRTSRVMDSAILPGQLVLPAVNAFRKQLFVGAWLHVALDRPLRLIAASQCVDAEQWCNDPLSVLPISAGVPPVLSGPGLRSFPPLADQGCRLAPASAWDPSALEVAQLGWLHFQAGESVSAVELLPNYVRASAAEDVLAGRK